MSSVGETLEHALAALRRSWQCKAARTAPLRSGTVSRRSRACLRPRCAYWPQKSLDQAGQCRPRTAPLGCRGGGSRFERNAGIRRGRRPGETRRANVSRMRRGVLIPAGTPASSTSATVDCFRPRCLERLTRENEAGRWGAARERPGEIRHNMPRYAWACTESRRAAVAVARLSGRLRLAGETSPRRLSRTRPLPEPE